MRIDSIRPTDLLDLAEHLLRLIISLPENERPERKGFYLCVRDRVTGLILLLVPIGEFDDLKFARTCARLAQEKTERLLSHPEHIASSQSAIPELELYGGAVVCQVSGVDIGISGLTATCDEAVAAILGHKMGWILDQQVSDLARLVNNQAIISLRRAAT